MSFDDDFSGNQLVELYEAFGTVATVQRGAGIAVPVRIIVNRGQERLGDYGVVVARVDTISFQCSQWVPQQGDIVAWSDRFGTHSKAVEMMLDNDGLEAKAVLHG